MDVLEGGTPHGTVGRAEDKRAARPGGAQAAFDRFLDLKRGAFEQHSKRVNVAFQGDPGVGAKVLKRRQVGLSPGRFRKGAQQLVERLAADGDRSRIPQLWRDWHAIGDAAPVGGQHALARGHRAGFVHR